MLSFQVADSEAPFPPSDSYRFLPVTAPRTTTGVSILPRAGATPGRRFPAPQRGLQSHSHTERFFRKEFVTAVRHPSLHLVFGALGGLTPVHHFRGTSGNTHVPVLLLVRAGHMDRCRRRFWLACTRRVMLRGATRSGAFDYGNRRGGRRFLGRSSGRAVECPVRRRVDGEGEGP